MQKQYRLLYDENLCIGCQACSVACRVENSVPDEVYRVQVHMQTLGTFPNLGMNYERLSCVMCENPPCVSVCPTNASFQSKDGLVHIDEKSCISCKYCILACPYHARFINPLKNVVEKCTFCYETRVSKELLPACVSTCPTDALTFGDMRQKDSLVHQKSHKEVLVFPKAHLGTKPKVAFIPNRKGLKIMSPMWGSVEQYSTIHWSWAIAIYLFLAGLSSGSIIVALLVKWNRHERSNSSIWDAMIKAGAVVAPMAIFLGLLLLVIDLGRPLSFYWLLIRYNITSVMSLGVLFLLIYTPIVMVFMLLVFERSVIKHPFLAPLEGFINLVKSFHSYAKIIEYFLFGAALCVGSYTGFLLSALYAIPLWNSPLLPILFLTSSLSSGVAVNILIGLLFFKSTINTESIKYLLVLDTRVILTELPLLGLFFIGMFYAGGDAPSAAKAALTQGFWAGIFWLGVIGVGLGLPLLTVIVALRSHVYRVGYVVINSMVVILGVLMLRYYIIYAGQIYLG